MPVRTLITLAQFSFQIGLIGHNEYVERCEVALWLGDEAENTPDPRGTLESERENEDSVELSAESKMKNRRYNTPPGFLEFQFKKWLFTKADPDDYPSTPHGHLLNPNRRWPKLNPYTGRAFDGKHKENDSLRLKKTEMQELWQKEAFRDFCRSYILWYMEQFPNHSFPVSNPLHLPRW